jgi:hypothetical protein
LSGHVLYLVGGPPRVGKSSSLAQRLVAADGIPWLPTDVVRTVVRQVVPEIDAVDQDPVDFTRLADVMYPYIEQAAEVCADEAEQFLIEGFELSPSYPARLEAALAGVSVRACFLAATPCMRGATVFSATVLPREGRSLLPSSGSSLGQQRDRPRARHRHPGEHAADSTDHHDPASVKTRSRFI